jgi:hypothetical protein
VAGINEKGSTYKFGLGESVGTGTLARTRRRLKDNIKVDVREIDSEAVWINGDQNMEQ